MIGSDNIRKGPDRTWAPRGIGHAVTFRCWKCDRTKGTHGAKLIGKLKLKVCAECSNAELSGARTGATMNDQAGGASASNAGLGPAQKRAANAAARAMWTRDGRPERNLMAPGSVGLHNYQDWAEDTVATLLQLGYTVTPPKRSRA